jgi:predicted lipoprotein with Yx(FWY)xxD motif
VSGSRALMAGVLSGLALVAACGGPPQVAAQPQGRQLTPAHAAGLFVVESRVLGSIVVDGQGYVLYRFDGDSADPPKSTCVDSCTNDWLPVPAVDGLTVVGIDRQLVGRLTRTDGSAQLTLAGWPLYGYAGDRMPGDANGQLPDNRWSVIAPNGARVFPNGARVAPTASAHRDAAAG